MGERVIIRSFPHKAVNRFRAAIGLSVYWRGAMALLVVLLATLAVLANTEYQSLRSLELEIDELAGVRWAAANRQSIQMLDRTVDLRPPVEEVEEEDGIYASEDAVRGRRRSIIDWSGDGRVVHCQCFQHTNMVCRGAWTRVTIVQFRHLAMQTF